MTAPTAQQQDERDGSAGRLAAELVAAGVLTHGVAIRVLLTADKTAGAVIAPDVLRIAATIAPRWPDRDEYWFSLLTGALIGYRQSTGTEAITSDEELDSAAAVAEFTLRATTMPPGLITTKHNGRGAFFILDNRDLLELLRKRPEDLDRITDYIADRGAPGYLREPVDALREWLDTEATPVGDGWL